VEQKGFEPPTLRSEVRRPGFVSTSPYRSGGSSGDAYEEVLGIF